MKELVDTIIQKSTSEWVLNFGMDFQGTHPQGRKLVEERWKGAGGPPIAHFLPYFSYVFTVRLFFYLGMGADLISRERASHSVDIAYLYYLPFSMVFASNDKLHISTVPLFQRDNQSFVLGTELKADLADLDRHYSTLPEQETNQGVTNFAAHPPTDKNFLTTRLWDKHLPSWRGSSKRQNELRSEASKLLAKRINQFVDEAVPLPPSRITSMAEVDQLTISRKVSLRKGKWRRFSPEIEAASQKEPTK